MDGNGLGESPALGVVVDLGAPTKRKRGRPKKTPTPKPAAAPAAPPRDPLEAAAAAEAPTPADAAEGWFSAEADAARCRRAEAQAKGWLEPARFATRLAEGIARNIVLRDAMDRMPEAEARDRLARVPTFASVSMTPEGAAYPATVEDGVAHALAIIAAYFAPPLLEHPLAQAGMMLASAGAVYSSALRAAVVT